MKNILYYILLKVYRFAQFARIGKWHIVPNKVYKKVGTILENIDISRYWEEESKWQEKAMDDYYENYHANHNDFYEYPSPTDVKSRGCKDRKVIDFAEFLYEDMMREVAEQNYQDQLALEDEAEYWSNVFDQGDGDSA